MRIKIRIKSTGSVISNGNVRQISEIAVNSFYFLQRKLSLPLQSFSIFKLKKNSQTLQKMNKDRTQSLFHFNRHSITQIDMEIGKKYRVAVLHQYSYEQDVVISIRATKIQDVSIRSMYYLK